jgi:4-hydroxybenzoate polyprenyltransferase
MDARARSQPRLRDAWAVLRVRQWMVFAPLPAAGIARLDEVRGARMSNVAGAVVASGLALAYAYGLNAIADRRADEDPDKNVLAGREEVPVPAIVSVICAGLAALLAAGALGGLALPAIAASIAAGTVYSAGPRLKRFPALGLLANHAIFLPLLFPAVRPGAAPVGLWLLAPVFALLLTQNQLLHEESDAAEDEAAGVTTTARRLGARGVRYAVVALAAGIAVAGAMTGRGAVLGVCAVGAVATAGVGLSDHPASLRRRAHRYLAAMVGVALFLASLGAGHAG